MISVTILTFQSERCLKEVLDSLKEFDDIIILDSGSTDKTLEIASQYPNTKIHKSNFLGFGKMHNLATSFCRNNWILSIDSDEIISPQLKQELLSVSLNPSCVYRMPFHNFYNKKWIRWCGWYPDKHIRLYHKATTKWTESFVHEGIESSHLKIIDLKNPIHHYSYSCVSDFLKKMQTYSELFANQNIGKKTSSPFKACWHSFAAFLKAYILKLGFLGGYEGFLISMYNAHTAFYKYLKLYEKNKTHQQ